MRKTRVFQFLKKAGVVALCVSLLFGAFLPVTAQASGAHLVRNYNNGHPNFNRIAARDYAARWVTTRNPAFSNFDGIGGNCTNFVSQALAAGGISFTTRVTSPTQNHWYYFSGGWGWGRTSSWTTASYFRRHFADNNEQGFRRSLQMRVYRPTDITTRIGGQTSNTDRGWNDLFNNIGAGDVVQFMRTSVPHPTSNAGTWETFHSAIVHRKSLDDANGRVSMAQNSADGWRNLREVARNMINTSNQDIIWFIIIRMNAVTTW